MVEYIPHAKTNKSRPFKVMCLVTSNLFVMTNLEYQNLLIQEHILKNIKFLNFILKILQL